MTDQLDVSLLELLSSEYGIEGSLSRLAGENDNFLVVEPTGMRYVFKVAGDDRPADVLELEYAAVEALAAADLGLGLPRVIFTRHGQVESSCTRPGGDAIRGRLLQFVDGVAWCEAGAVTSERRADLGRRLAQITAGLSSFDHPAARRTHRWDLSSVEGWRQNVDLVVDPDHRALLNRAYSVYFACAKQFLADLPHSVIHGDLNDENLLVAENRVVGLLDFGDCLYNPTVCELAIGLTYAVLDDLDPLATGAEIVASYHEVRPLQAAELEILYPLICGRLASTVSTAAERRVVDPDRSAWFAHEERARTALRRLLEIEPVQAARRLAADTGQVIFGDQGASRDDLLVRREQHFTTSLSVSYEEPLKIVRGRGQFLFDERGRPYLDLYNNVCHVGHCHPRVVAAGAKQMELLNTNTRYLYDGLTEYAERLCATLPAGLEYCFFVNSGSEANELALRLARTHTGYQDMLVVEGAYHGHTTTMIDISPYKFLGKGGRGEPQDWVHLVPVADGYRGPFKGQGRDAGVSYGNEVGRVISSLDRPVAGFITESLLSCGGQVIPPEGYLATAFDHVRVAGGVCIADEVQVGFGRVGTHFWAFETQDVVPDIVVMGKPIGNGHPMAAVVTTREIAESFANTGMEFFATFGGNPVSCAIGMAVLDVVRDENLQSNALTVGTRLRDGLAGLMDTYSLIGDVRGAGLFVGVELVRDRNSLEPAAEEAERLVDGLRQRGVLTGTEGIFGNVIKIKGPMVLTESDVALAIAAFDDGLSQLDQV